MFADMGIQPTTLDASLILATQSTDTIKPIATITSPTVGASFVEGQKVTITGTAQDFGGGIIAGVEISTRRRADLVEGDRPRELELQLDRPGQREPTRSWRARSMTASISETPSAGAAGNGQPAIDVEPVDTRQPTPRARRPRSTGTASNSASASRRPPAALSTASASTRDSTTSARTPSSLWTSTGTLLATGVSVGEADLGLADGDFLVPGAYRRPERPMSRPTTPTATIRRTTITSRRPTQNGLLKVLPRWRRLRLQHQSRCIPEPTAIEQRELLGRCRLHTRIPTRRRWQATIPVSRSARTEHWPISFAALLANDTRCERRSADHHRRRQRDERNSDARRADGQRHLHAERRLQRPGELLLYDFGRARRHRLRPT